jgi:carotenoid 1,2-hydratase
VRAGSALGASFAEAIPRDGYRWFYLDVVSDDGSEALVVIALVGNPFSPRYARARARAAADPLDFCAMNVALHTRGGRRWALTEHARHAVSRTETSLAIGGSSMRVEHDALLVEISETCAPFGGRIEGSIRFTPTLTTTMAVALDSRALHSWHPLAPLGRATVELAAPRLSFTGTAYLDMNEGEGALEDAFARWSWTRVSSANDTFVVYDTVGDDGAVRERAFAFSEASARTFEPMGRSSLGSTLFGLRRESRGHLGLVRTIEDGPFYARSVVRANVAGRDLLGVHEHVDLARFASSWVRFLIPFRMRIEAP